MVRNSSSRKKDTPWTTRMEKTTFKKSNDAPSGSSTPTMVKTAGKKSKGAPTGSGGPRLRGQGEPRPPQLHRRPAAEEEPVLHLPGLGQHARRGSCRSRTATESGGHCPRPVPRRLAMATTPRVADGLQKPRRPRLRRADVARRAEPNGRLPLRVRGTKGKGTGNKGGGKEGGGKKGKAKW